jgi:hypothetical protein
MAAQSFAGQPAAVKLGLLLTLYNSFVLIEELIIDRHGLAKFLPCYQIGNFCIYDGLVLAALGLAVFTLPRRRTT